jgi:hypothetical protein
MSGGALQVAAVVALHQPNPPFNGGAGRKEERGVCVVNECGQGPSRREKELVESITRT